jgi:hypothetical protein
LFRSFQFRKVTKNRDLRVTVRGRPRSMHRELEELCDSLKMPQDYADRMDSIGLSYGAVITMKPSDLMLMLALIMKPEQSQIFARHVLLMNSNQCHDSREHLCHG